MKLLQTIINTLRFYNRISLLFCLNRKITPLDYEKDYDTISGNYDTTWIKHMNSFSKEMLNEITLKAKQSMLDLACGTGALIESVLAVNPNITVTGIDISKDMIAQARKKTTNSRISFIHGDVMTEILKIEDKSFDIVTMAWALVYVDRQRFLKEIHRVLRPGGTLAVIVNRKGTIQNVNRAFLTLMKQEPGAIKTINDIALKLPQDSLTLEKEFRRAGFKWKKGWDRERRFSFNSGRDAVEWVYTCGAMAGTLGILEFDDTKNRLAKIMEQENKSLNEIQVTHKFSVGIAKK